MAATTNLPMWIIASALALAGAAGAVLLLLGRGRRVGQEPHCRKCGYNLTGLTAERCPECGRPATGRNVVTGVRIRRWRLLATGATLLVLGLAGGSFVAIGAARGVNWHAYLPTFALIELARADDGEAIKELANRVVGSADKPTALIALAPLALQHQGVRPRVPSGYYWTDFLAALEVGGYLTAPQIQQFHEQIVSFELRFRPRVRQQDEFAITFDTWTTGSPRLRGTCSIENGTLRVGDFVQQFETVGFSEGRLSQHGGGGPVIPIPIHQFDPGKYKVEFDAEQFFTNPAFKRDISLEYDLEILPAESAEVVRLVKDANIGQQLRQAITVDNADQRLGAPQPGDFSLMVAANSPVPMDVAFRVLLRAGGREVEIGKLTWKASPKGGWRAQAWQYPIAGLEGISVTPILRTSIDVAKAEPDMVEIWDGELVFPPIQLKSSAPATSTAPSSGP